MIIEDESILNENDKQYIETVVLGEHISFFWAENQAENDSKPYLYHTLIHRKTQQIHSDYANFFKDLVKKFAIKHKLECRVFLRGCINLSFPMKGKGTPHRDHTFPHRQVIIYLNNSHGNTVIFDKVFDPITKITQYNVEDIVNHFDILAEIPCYKEFPWSIQ